MSNDKNDKLEFNKCLEMAKDFHGDACGGIQMGTRMAISGMKAIGITDPHGEDRKDLMVFVEIDRCPTDAIIAVTGCHPGKRTMKILDHGKMAATFINLKTNKAVRVSSNNRQGDTIKNREMIESEPMKDDFAALADNELFTVTEVKVHLNPEDLPGRPVRSIPCASCGERVLDMKDVEVDGKFYCRPCAEKKSYYTII
ncbi:MAG TPA: FmdE family protein [Spirochaetota bacterium]|nr:FmdE family protein [Spirochaetota bacterium]